MIRRQRDMRVTKADLAARCERLANENRCLIDVRDSFRAKAADESARADAMRFGSWLADHGPWNVLAAILSTVILAAGIGLCVYALATSVYSSTQETCTTICVPR
jgi:hypothetical protein